MPNSSKPRDGHTIGHVRDSLTIEVDDAALTAIHAAGGKALVIDSSGDHSTGELVHDGTSFVVRLEGPLRLHVRSRVLVRPRGGSAPSCSSARMAQPGVVSR